MPTSDLNFRQPESSPARDNGNSALRRLRILVVPEWYPCESVPTSGVFIKDQALAAARFHDVTVLVHDPTPRPVGGAAVTSGMVDGLRVVRVRTRARHGTRAGRVAFLLVAARVLRRMRRHGQAPDIIHAHVFSAGLVALMLSRGRQPVVVSEHHTDFIEGKVAGWDARVASFVFRRADLVCPVSSRLKHHLEALQPSGRYAVVPEVVDVEAFLGMQPHRASRPRTRFLVVAMLSPQKGIEYLLEAFAQAHQTRADLTLDVVGDGPGRRVLENIAQSRLPAGVVRFHGERSRAEVASFMMDADVFVLPTVVETFCVVLIEAVAAGLPIITTTAVPDHTRFARLGLVVEPRDTDALRNAILKMLDQPLIPPQEVAIETAQSFSMLTVSQRWDHIYRTLARTL